MLTASRDSATSNAAVLAEALTGRLQTDRVMESVTVTGARPPVFCPSDHHPHHHAETVTAVDLPVSSPADPDPAGPDGAG